MEIRITRTKNGHAMLHCTRPDRSATWLPLSPFFVIHDLCHYAVETTLGFRNAFYGMLASGREIRDFELPKAQRTFQLTPEALQAEQLVNLLVIEFSQGRIDNFMEELEQVNRLNNERQMPVPLQATDLEKIRTAFAALTERWNELPENETLVLNFES